MVEPIGASDWMSVIEGARILGVSREKFPKYALRMGIRFREIPGRRGTLWHRGDLQAALRRLERIELKRAQPHREEWEREHAVPPAKSVRPKRKKRTE
jgi:hypothetical protein